MPRFASRRQFSPFGEAKIAMLIPNWLKHPSASVAKLRPIQVGNYSLLLNFILAIPILTIAKMFQSNMGSLEPVKLRYHFGSDQVYDFWLIQQKVILI